MDPVAVDLHAARQLGMLAPEAARDLASLYRMRHGEFVEVVADCTSSA